MIWNFFDARRRKSHACTDKFNFQWSNVYILVIAWNLPMRAKLSLRFSPIECRFGVNTTYHCSRRIHDTLLPKRNFHTITIWIMKHFHPTSHWSNQLLHVTSLQVFLNQYIYIPFLWSYSMEILRFLDLPVR